MIEFPEISPIAFELGPLRVHWYGLSYLIGIGLGWIYLHKYVSRYQEGWPRNSIDDLVFCCSLGAVLGGRAGYVLFYDFSHFLLDPISIFEVWKGGMSFHGGLIGVTLAILYLAFRTDRSVLTISDFVVPAIPIGLGFGRLANFVNQELWGIPSNLPWAVIFSTPSSGYVPRHPSQLYEAFAEGLLLFVILAILVRLAPTKGRITAVFLGFYGVLRFLVEFVRVPDTHLGYISGGWVTMGQVLSLPMVFAGLAIWVICGDTPSEKVKPRDKMMKK